MKKILKYTFLLIPLLLSACSTPNEDNSEPSSTASSSSESITINTGVLRGHGAPSQDIGEANSLYVDEDTGLIYEKGVKVSARTSSAKRAVTSDAKWINTKCRAGDNFEDGNAIGKAVRSSFYATNVTYKLTMDIEMTAQPAQHVISYLAYNCGNVLMKNVTNPADDSFENALSIGYSIYDNDNDTYTALYLREGGSELSDCTELIAQNDPRSYSFLDRCIGNYFDNKITPDLYKAFIEDINSFTLANGVYSLGKTIDTTSPLTTQLGSNDTFVKLSDFSFKLNTAGDALEYFQFGISFGLNDQSLVFNEVIKAEVQNLRTTTF